VSLRLLAPTIAALALPLVLLATAPVAAEGTSPGQPILKKAKERGAPPVTTDASTDESAAGGGMTRQRRLALCLESWDTQTHMSKREWRVACERSIKGYPDAFQ